MEYFVYKFTCPKCKSTKLICADETIITSYCYCIKCKMHRVSVVIVVKFIEDTNIDICPKCHDLVPIDKTGNCVNCQTNTEYKAVFPEEEESLISEE